jgi:hypothetical protein
MTDIGTLWTGASVDRLNIDEEGLSPLATGCRAAGRHVGSVMLRVWSMCGGCTLDRSQ